MAFRYDPPYHGELRQGEILLEVYEPRVRYELDDQEHARPTVDRRQHPRMVVLTPDCDLLKDYTERTKDSVKIAHMVDCVLLCDLYADSEITAVLPTAFGAKEWKRIDGNQDERYHHFPAAPIGDLGDNLPKLYLDFKRCVALPTEYLYQCIRSGLTTRAACIGPVFLQDLVHRVYSFLARVGPDFS